MSFNRRWLPRNELTGSQPSSRSGYNLEGGPSEIATATRTQESSGNSAPSSVAHQEQITPVIIKCQDYAYSVVFLADGKHVVSRSNKAMVRCWQVDDGREAETLMDAESQIFSIAISCDGRWIVGGTKNGFVEVWNTETNERMKGWKAHKNPVRTVDVSQDGTRIVSGSADKTVCVWSRSTGQLLLGPLLHDAYVAAAKFSLDGRLFATATWRGESVRVYDGRDGSLLIDLPISVVSSNNDSLAWTDDGRLSAISHDGLIHCIDASTGATLARWPIHNNQGSSIAITKNGAFIAASSGSTVSLWDVSSQNRVGSVLHFTHQIWSLAISDNLHLAVCGENEITLCSLYGVLPTPYIIDELRARLTESQQAYQQSDKLIQSIRAQEETSNTRIAQLEKANQDLRNKLSKSQHILDDRNKTINLLHAQKTSSDSHIQDLSNQLSISHREQDQLNKTVESLRVQEESSNNEVTRLGRVIHAHEQVHHCESLYNQGRILDAVQYLIGVDEEMKENELLAKWLTEFTGKCIDSLEKIGDKASAGGERDGAMAAYAASLSLTSLASSAVLMKWSRITLIGCSVFDTLSATTKFKVSRFSIYRAICNILEEDGRFAEAVECFRQMKNELLDDKTDDERAEWEYDFRVRCSSRLVKLGDAARDDEDHKKAIACYSDALYLVPENNEILLKCSNERIELDPSSHQGYTEKHAALQGMRRYHEAFEAFRLMLSKLEQSPSPRMRELRQQYLDIAPLIQQTIHQTISPMPRLLIDAETGRLYDKALQAAVFEEFPIYDELRSSMINRSQLDLARIQDEVKKFYRYVMFSHRWELNGEPLLQDVQNSTVYVLKATSPNIKLQTLCKIVQKLGFKWVWSDTCCIDKDSNVVLQESLVAMFSWYRGSALTLVHLRGVWSHSQKPGHLRRSVWNSRAWTYQEYLAAEIVQFYTEDWKPYLDLDLFNHKESPSIIEEMEPEVGISVRESALLRPGLDRVREKLSLASARETTYVEDIAYSLLGIFNASIPVIYGERYRAVGRLLEYVLTGSGDVSILAWTGHPGEYNSCLPLDLTAYNQVIPPHIPLPMETREMDRIVARLRSSSQLDHTLLGTLYHRLRYLPKLRMAASRLELPGIVFHVPKLVRTSDPDPETKVCTYRARTPALGDIEIRTADDLSGMTDLVLVHPWIRPLLHQEFVEGTGAHDKATQALRLLARLGQPFGALLFQQLSLVDYKRVAADSLIIVQMREEVSLVDLIDNVTTIEVQ